MNPAQPAQMALSGKADQNPPAARPILTNSPKENLIIKWADESSEGDKSFPASLAARYTAFTCRFHAACRQFAAFAGSPDKGKHQGSSTDKEQPKEQPSSQAAQLDPVMSTMQEQQDKGELLVAKPHATGSVEHSRATEEPGLILSPSAEKENLHAVEKSKVCAYAEHCTRCNVIGHSDTPMRSLCRRQSWL